MPTHLTPSLRGCRLRDCGAPDCPTCMGAEAARIYREQQACEHEEVENFMCLHCGAELDPGEATDRAMDSVEDR